jgi:VanZ family protein
MSIRRDRLLVMWLLVATAVAYGSLYPFRLVIGPGARAERFAEFWTSFELGGRGDILSNIVLFVPFGFLGLLVWRHRYLSVVTLGTLFGFVLQLGQIMIRGRIPALGDVVWNGIGTWIGTGVASLSVSRSLIEKKSLPAPSYPLLLALLWVSYRLFPFVPELDWQAIKDSLKPLLLDPHLGTLDVLRNLAGWLVFAILFETIADRHFHRRQLLAAVGFILGSQVLIDRNWLTAPNVLGAVLALALWWAARRHHLETRVGAIVLAGTIVLLGLDPFRLGTAGPFHLLPFHGFLSGSMFVNLSQLFLKLYFYGALLWLTTRSGVSLRGATISIAIALLLIELVQPWLPGRTAEITDPILVLMASGLMRALPSEHEAHESDSSPGE